MNFPAASAVPAERARAWTATLDAFAAAASATVAATSVRELRAGLARALAGSFADWAIVDLAPWGPHSRSVAGPRPEPGGARALATLPPRSSPLIVSAMAQRTPLVQASLADPADLGVFPDGMLAAEVIGAGSLAVAPVTVAGAARGAITIVRGRHCPPVTFLELSVLARAADLAAAAVRRLDGARHLPGPRRWRLRA